MQREWLLSTRLTRHMTIAALGLPFADSTRVPCPLLGRRDSYDLRASPRGDLAKQDANVAVWPGHSQSPYHRTPEFSRPRVPTWSPEEPDPSCLGAPKAPEKGPQAPLLIAWSLCLWRCLATGPSHPGWWPYPDIRPPTSDMACPALYPPSSCQNCRHVHRSSRGWRPVLATRLW